MGVPLSEFVIETVLRDGLNELRINSDRLDDIFSKFLNAYFVNQYGQSKIDELKTHIQNKQVKIVQSWAMVPTEVPCISIELLRASEDEDIQQFSNEFEEESEAKTPTVYVNTITPGTYDSKTGKLIVLNVADLSQIHPGLVFVDASGVKFPMHAGNSNLLGNKFINIGKDQDPDLSGDGYIESSIDETRTRRRMIRIRETLRLGVHAANDIHLTKYLYYLLIYILKSRQSSLIDRGINLDKGIGEVFDRDDSFQGENIFSRFLTMSCLTEFDWDQEEVNLFDNFDITTKAPMPDPDSEVAIKVNTSDD